MIVEIIEVGDISFLTTPLERDIWDLFYILEEAGFIPQVVCFDGYENAVTVFSPKVAYLNGY